MQKEAVCWSATEKGDVIQLQRSIRPSAEDLFLHKGRVSRQIGSGTVGSKSPADLTVSSPSGRIKKLMEPDHWLL